MINKPVKKFKGLKQAHTSNKKIGMGEYQGTGVIQKVGKVKYSSMNPNMSKSNLNKPPKNLA